MHRFLAPLLLSSVVLLSKSSTPVFTKRDLAYYANQAVVNFVRPGLVVKIGNASLGSNGTIQVQFTIADPQGLPLDRAGVNTPGAVSTSFIASYIPKGQTDYVALTARPATGAVSGTVNQPAADSGGTYAQTGDGQYTYTFGTKAPAGFDTSQTVTIGMYASRDLSQFQLGTNSANAVFSFTPNGTVPADVHDVIHTATCNKCHDPLQAHGGARREVALCVLCHNPGGNNGNVNVQTVDPDTGNSIDFRVLIHKIHMGSSLPSVQAGHPYQIIGFNNSVTDFPEWSSRRMLAIAKCVTKMERRRRVEPGRPAPNRRTPRRRCKATGGSRTDPRGMRIVPRQRQLRDGREHANLPQLTDNLCSSCHFPQASCRSTSRSWAPTPFQRSPRDCLESFSL